MPNTVETRCVLKAPPERVYRALLDPHALVKWYAPSGFTARIHHLEPKVGGLYRMSFTNFGSGKAHSFEGKYLELTPNEKVQVMDTFDDPNFAAEMQTTYTLREVPLGTDLSVVQEGLPDSIPPEACRLGWQESLALLADLVEPDIPD